MVVASFAYSEPYLPAMFSPSLPYTFPAAWLAAIARRGGNHNGQAGMDCATPATPALLPHAFTCARNRRAARRQQTRAAAWRLAPVITRAAGGRRKGGEENSHLPALQTFCNALRGTSLLCLPPPRYFSLFVRFSSACSPYVHYYYTLLSCDA